MSVVADFFEDVVGGAVEFVGDVVGGAVDIVKDVGSAIDDYVIQPILDDPLTAVATIAGATYLGPIIGSQFGLASGSAIATGAGAATGNFASNLAQGEDFDQALKEATFTGLTVGGTKALTNYFTGPDVGPPSPEVSGPPTPAQPNYFADLNAIGDYYPADSLYELSLDNFAPGETLPFADYSFSPSLSQAQANFVDASYGPFDTAAAVDYANYGPQLPTDYLPPDSIYEMGLDGFAPGETLPGVDVGPQTPVSYFDQVMSELEAADPRMQEPGFNVPEFAPDAPLPTDLTGKIDFTRILEPIEPLNLGKLGPPAGMGTVGTPAPSMFDALPSLSDLGSLDYWGGLAGNAIDYAMENPLTVAGGALLLDAAVNPPKMPPPPVRRPNETDEQFAKRLQLYEYQRSRMQYEGNLAEYGYNPQHQFYTPSQFVPIERPAEGAAAGGLMQSQPKYYRYGQQPMARGGRMITSPLAQYGQGGAHGRSDDVPAVLSDGEYVIDAETVALLGNGSVDAGANQLDRMREEIRRHKGKSLAKGKISEDARSPLSYLEG